MRKDIYSAASKCLALPKRSKNDVELHVKLKDELRATGCIQPPRNHDEVIDTLPKTYLELVEDSYVQHRLNPFIISAFVGEEYDLTWAKKQLEGSQARRNEVGRERYRPDFIVRKNWSSRPKEPQV
ncbi:hypothetical protein BGX23_007055 [Mortierella sp. AD031]|nr:hypothetical protein BGX23_007055 [Mortierella sp. AD031]